MPSKAVSDAFEAKMGHSWNGLPVVWMDDVLAEPPTNDYGFVVIQYPVANADKPVLGRRYCEEGAARIVLAVKREVGKGQGLSWSDSIAAMFRSQKQLNSVTGLETFVPNGPIINDANDNGLYVEFAVIVPYRYQFDG